MVVETMLSEQSMRAHTAGTTSDQRILRSDSLCAYAVGRGCGSALRFAPQQPTRRPASAAVAPVINEDGTCGCSLAPVRPSTRQTHESKPICRPFRAKPACLAPASTREATAVSSPAASVSAAGQPEWLHAPAGVRRLTVISRCSDRRKLAPLEARPKTTRCSSQLALLLRHCRLSS